MVAAKSSTSVIQKAVPEFDQEMTYAPSDRFPASLASLSSISYKRLGNC